MEIEQVEFGERDLWNREKKKTIEEKTEKKSSRKYVKSSKFGVWCDELNHCIEYEVKVTYQCGIIIPQQYIRYIDRYTLYSIVISNELKLEDDNVLFLVYVCLPVICFLCVSLLCSRLKTYTR